MPQSLSAVYIHLVFSTKVSKQLDCPPILVGGVEDHIHLLARFGRTITQAEWVKELKRVSNLWLKERSRDYANFEWQDGPFLREPIQSRTGEAIHHRTGGAPPQGWISGRIARVIA